jgi:hypothetical protein
MPSRSLREEPLFLRKAVTLPGLNRTLLVEVSGFCETKTFDHRSLNWKWSGARRSEYNPFCGLGPHRAMPREFVWNSAFAMDRRRKRMCYPCAYSKAKGKSPLQKVL